MNDKETTALAENRMRKEILGLVWLALGIFLLICLLSYSNDDPSFNNNLHPEQVQNLIGVFGAHLADLMYQTFGLTALLWPLGCLHLAWRWLKFNDVHFRITRLIAFLLMQITLGALLALRFNSIPLFGQQIDEAGGTLGRILVQILTHYLNVGGAAIVLIVFFLVALILSTRFSFVLFIDGFLDRLGRRLEMRREARRARRELKKKTRQQRDEKGPAIITSEPKNPTPPAPGKKSKKRANDKEDAQVAFSFLEASGDYHLPPVSLLNTTGPRPNRLIGTV
jgi:S-DNA-T family DNA segregation ATPase FtsK/SpoIIIE